MRIQEVINYLHAIAPPVYQESYDNSGLLVGDANRPLTAVLLSLDITEAVVEEAISMGANLIIAHHPIIFSGLKRLTGKNHVERTVIKAIKNDIALFAIHTNLDNVFYNGVNEQIAKRLGLKDLKILAPKTGVLKKLITYVPKEALSVVQNALFKAGAGNIGNYEECSFTTKGTGTFLPQKAANPVVGKKYIRNTEEEIRLELILPKDKKQQVLNALIASHPYEEVAYELFSIENNYQHLGAGMVGNLERPIPVMEFLEFLKDSMKTDCVRYTAPHTKEIQRVAVCGGAGGFLLNHAINAKADIFITADYKYHEFFAAESRIIIADIGHYETEQFTIDLFYELLSKKISNFKIQRTSINTNPVNYL